MGKINSRRKGAVGERAFRDQLRDAGYCKAYRTAQFCGSTVSMDVTCPELPDIHWEVKNVESGNPYTWLDQAIRDSKRIRYPVVAHKRNNRRWIAILELRDLLDIIRRSDLPKVHSTTTSIEPGADVTTPGQPPT